MVGYVFRIRRWPPAAQPPFELTPGQQRALAAFQSALRRLPAAATAVAPGEDHQLQRTDRACLDFLVSLLDHPLPGPSYDSVLLSALAIVGIREDGGWATPDNYTPYYSAVIKVARMLVVRQAQLEADEGESEGGIFGAVRDKVRRFLTTVHADNSPTPVD